MSRHQINMDVRNGSTADIAETVESGHYAILSLGFYLPFRTVVSKGV